MLSNVPVVIDASTLINLAASDCLAEVLTCLSAQRFICSAVKGECLYIRSLDGMQIEPAHPSQWLADGLLAECDLVQAEEERFVTYAASIDDGEAMSLAIAEARGYALASDDRKARRLAEAANIPTISTAAILKEWSKNKKPAKIAHVLTTIENRARFRPPHDDPDYQWWLANRALA